jgi:hypothetical protein
MAAGALKGVGGDNHRWSHEYGFGTNRVAEVHLNNVARVHAVLPTHRIAVEPDVIQTVYSL